MLRSIGKISKSFFIKALVGIIILPFVFWGMGDVFRGGNQNIIATIDNKKINTQEFVNYLNSLNLNKEQRKGIKNSDTIERVLSSYVGRKVLELEIEKLGISLTDSSLREIIINDENFFKDKKFSRTKYEKFLIESGVTASLFEKNISQQEKKMQFLSYLSDGFVIPEFLVQSEFNKENQIKSIQYVDLNKYYENKKPKRDEVLEIYEKNKKFFVEIYKNLSYAELNPIILLGKNDLNDQYFKIIDNIENDILDGKDIKQISSSFNLKLLKTDLLNNLKKDTDGKTNNNINNNLFKKMISIKNEKKPELIKVDNKYFIVEVSEISKKEKNVDDKEVLKSIYKQIDIKRKLENNTTIVKEISEGTFDVKQMFAYAKKNNLEVNNSTIKSTKDNTIFNEGLIKSIFATNDGQVNLITDGMLENNFIIFSKNTEYKKIKKGTEEFKEYKAKAKLDFATNIYNTYDKSLNTKYKVVPNNKTIERIKNSF